MQQMEPLSYGEFNGESMESQRLKKAISALFFTVLKQKSQQSHFCNLLTFRAETEIWTRDPFITSEVLYRWAISYFRWKSVIYME